MANNAIKIKKFLDKCNEFENCKMLFIDKKINELLDIVADTKEIYEIVSECIDNFNRDKEYERAFVVDGNGKHYFVQPKEEFKVIALDFCLLADIASGRLNIDALISKYFKNPEGNTGLNSFIASIVYSFRDLIAEAFGVSTYAVNMLANADEEDEEVITEQFKDMVETPIERVSQRLNENCNLPEVFDKVRSLTKRMLETLEIERRNEFVNDSELICHAIIIACLEGNFDMLNGLALGLKHVGKNIKSVRFYTKEIVATVQEQIDWSI